MNISSFNPRLFYTWTWLFYYRNCLMSTRQSQGRWVHRGSSRHGDSRKRSERTFQRHADPAVVDSHRESCMDYTALFENRSNLTSTRGLALSNTFPAQTEDHSQFMQTTNRGCMLGASAGRQSMSPSLSCGRELQWNPCIYTKAIPFSIYVDKTDFVVQDCLYALCRTVNYHGNMAVETGWSWHSSIAMFGIAGIYSFSQGVMCWSHWISSSSSNHSPAVPTQLFTETIKLSYKGIWDFQRNCLKELAVDWMRT